MATQTTNLNLIKPEYTDPADIMVVNGNMDIVDGQINNKLNVSLKGAANGLAELDANGKVPSSQLPSYVDDVIDGYYYNNKFYKDSAHTIEITGEAGKIYIDLVSEKTYRWSGSVFVVISESLALGETSSTAYRGDRGAAAYAAAVTNVESAPTSGSANLITSGGTYNALAEKAPKANPVFTGSISLGRDSSSTVGGNSVAEGNSVVASGDMSHAEGYGTTASGLSAHSEGELSSAEGDFSHAEGRQTTANHVSQHAGGEYNVADPSTAASTARGNYIEIIGNGTSNSARSNARALDWNGNERLNGDVYVGCNADSTGGTKLAKEVPMTGASASTAGASGLVPAPSAGDEDKFLQGDGTWGAVTSLTRQFWNLTSSVSVPLTSNGKVYFALCIGESGSASGAHNATIIVSNGQYIILNKGNDITVTAGSSALTISSTSSIAMAVIEI